MTRSVMSALYTTDLQSIEASYATVNAKQSNLSKRAMELTWEVIVTQCLYSQSKLAFGIYEHEVTQNLL